MCTARPSSQAANAKASPNLFFILHSTSHFTFPIVSFRTKAQTRRRNEKQRNRFRGHPSATAEQIETAFQFLTHITAGLFDGFVAVDREVMRIAALLLRLRLLLLLLLHLLLLLLLLLLRWWRQNTCKPRRRIVGQHLAYAGFNSRSFVFAAEVPLAFEAPSTPPFF